MDERGCLAIPDKRVVADPCRHFDVTKVLFMLPTSEREIQFPHCDGESRGSANSRASQKERHEWISSLQYRPLQTARPKQQKYWIGWEPFDAAPI